MDILPLAEVKDTLSSIIDRVHKQRDQVVITRNGRPVAVLVDYDWLESLHETLDILRDPTAIPEIQAAHDAIDRGDYYSLDEVAEALHTTSNS